MNKRQAKKFLKKNGCKTYPNRFEKSLAVKLIGNLDNVKKAHYWLNPLLLDISNLLYENDAIKTKRDSLFTVASYLRCSRKNVSNYVKKNYTE